MTRKAAYENIDSWMCLVRKVASSFPGMDFEEHEKTLRAFIDRGEALVYAPAADAVTSTAVLPRTTGVSIPSSGAAAPGSSMAQVHVML